MKKEKEEEEKKKKFPSGVDDFVVVLGNIHRLLDYELDTTVSLLQANSSLWSGFDTAPRDN